MPSVSMSCSAVLYMNPRHVLSKTKRMEQRIQRTLQRSSRRVLYVARAFARLHKLPLGSAHSTLDAYTAPCLVIVLAAMPSAPGFSDFNAGYRRLHRGWTDIGRSAEVRSDMMRRVPAKTNLWRSSTRTATLALDEYKRCRVLSGSIPSSFSTRSSTPSTHSAYAHLYFVSYSLNP